MRVEPNHRCSVQRPGSTARADGRDSGSASRFSAILRPMRATPPHRAIGIALPFQMLPNEGRWRPPRFPSGDFPSGFRPWIIIPFQRIEADRIRTRLKGTARAGRPGSATVAARQRKTGIQPPLAMIALFDKDIIHIALFGYATTIMGFNGFALSPFAVVEMIGSRFGDALPCLSNGREVNNAINHQAFLG